MATGTEGLGQPTTVFDFSGIAEKGKEMDDALLARKERWAKDNALLYSTPDTTLIRDVDSPYINEQAEVAMQLNAKAVQTKRPEDIQAANNQMANVSRLVAESRVGRVSMEKAKDAWRSDPAYMANPQVFTENMQDYTNRTAMTRDNKGKVGESIVYISPTAYNEPQENVDFFVKEHAAEIVQQAMDSYGQSIRGADGVEKGFSWEGLNESARREQINKYYDNQVVRAGNPKLTEALRWQTMFRYFGNRAPLDQEVARFEALEQEGNALKDQFASRDELITAYENRPILLRQKLEAWDMESYIDQTQREVYYEGVMTETTRQKKEKMSSDAYVSGGGSGADRQVAVNRGVGISDLLGSSFTLSQVQNADGTMRDDMPERLANRIAADGSMLGWSSAPNLTKKGIGSGSQGIITGGLISSRDKSGKVEYYVVEYKPSPDAWSKLEASDDIGEWLSKTDARIVPLSEARGRILENDLALMKSKADAESSNGMVEQSKTTQNSSSSAASNSTQVGGKSVPTGRYGN